MFKKILFILFIIGQSCFFIYSQERTFNEVKNEANVFFENTENGNDVHKKEIISDDKMHINLIKRNNVTYMYLFCISDNYS